MRADDPLGGPLARLEVPDCGCKPAAKPCGHEGPCDCEQGLFEQFAPPCRHVLGADHGLSPERWLHLMRCFDAAGHDDPPPPAAPAVALTRQSRLGVYAERAEAGVRLHFPPPKGTRRRTGDRMLPEDLEALGVSVYVESKRPGDLKSGELGRGWRPSRAELEDSGLSAVEVEEVEDALDASDDNDDVLSRCAKAARLRLAPPPCEAPAALPFVRPAAGDTPERRVA